MSRHNRKMLDEIHRLMKNEFVKYQIRWQLRLCIMLHSQVAPTDNITKVENDDIFRRIIFTKICFICKDMSKQLDLYFTLPPLFVAHGVNRGTFSQKNTRKTFAVLRISCRRCPR